MSIDKRLEKLEEKRNRSTIPRITNPRAFVDRMIRTHSRGPLDHASDYDLLLFLWLTDGSDKGCIDYDASVQSSREVGYEFPWPPEWPRGSYAQLVPQPSPEQLEIMQRAKG